MTVPVISVLRTQNPEIKITILTKKFFSALYNQIPDINFLFFNPKHKSVLGLFQLSREICKIKPDQIIDLHDVLRTKTLRLFLSFRFKNIFVINKGRREKESLIKGLNFSRLKSMHQRYADIFSSLEIDINLDSFTPYRKIKIDEKNHEFNLNNKLVGIAPFARHSCKEYSLTNILKLIDLIDPSHQILIFGAPIEEDKMKNIVAKKRNVFIISSKYSLDEQMAIISNLDIMISMDSANGHVAALFGLNVITIWGATHPYSGYGPINQPDENSIIPDLNLFPKIPVTIYGSNCPEDYVNAINSISPKKILERITVLI